MSGPVISMQQIATAVAQKRCIPLKDLRSDVRGRRVAYARHEAMFLMYQTGRWSLSQVGRFFDGRCHTSVLYAIRAHSYRETGGPPPKANRKPSAKQRERAVDHIVSMNGSRDGLRWGLFKSPAAAADTLMTV